VQLVTDPTEVKGGVEELEDENWEFRICPIVFNVIEGMKAELAWPGNDEFDWSDW
jgi:hypothetical protein